MTFAPFPPGERIGIAIQTGQWSNWSRAVRAGIACPTTHILECDLKMGLPPLLTNFKETLLKWFAAVDGRIFRCEVNPFSRVPKSEEISAESSRIRADWNGLEWEFDARNRATIRALNLQVIVWLIDGVPSALLSGLTEQGVLIFSFGGAFKLSIAGFAEVINQKSIIETSLNLFSPNASLPTVLYRSCSSVDPESLIRTRTKVLMKSAKFVGRALSLNLLGDISPSSLDRHSPPGPLVLASHVGRVFCRRTKRRMKEQWFLGLSFTEPWDPERTSIPVLKEIIPPPDRFWADPFPEYVDGEYFIFAEELLYETNKGRIIVMKVHENGAIEPPEVVLERPYHLSYPFTFEWRGQHYMIPESSANNQIELYECVNWPVSWRFAAVLIENVRAVDSTLVNQDGVWYLLTTIGGPGYPCTDELFIFSATTPLGPWMPMKSNPAVSDVRFGRSAGRLIQHTGVLYRPAQDCSTRYGGAISVRRLDAFGAQVFRETEVSRIEPNWKHDLVGTHTVNQTSRLLTIDGCRKIKI